MKLKAKIAGRKVHDVGYRVFMLDRAQELYLRGFEAVNRKENGGQVVLVFMEGDEYQIAELKEYIEKETPPDAEVSAIVFEDYLGSVLDIDKFHQRTNTQQLNKGINALLRIDKKQDVMIEKQDVMIGKLDETRADIVHEIRGSGNAIIDQLGSEIRKSSDVIIKELGGEIRASSDAIIDQLGGEIRESKDAIVDKLDEAGVVITREIRGQKSGIDQRFDRIEEDISRIKSKIGIS